MILPDRIVAHTFAFHIGPLEITGFGIAVHAAFFIAQFVCERELARRGQMTEALAMGDVTFAALLGTLVGGNVGERIFAASPARAVRITGAAIAAFSCLLAFAVFLPSVWMFVPAAWVGLFFLQVGIAPLYTALSAISPFRPCRTTLE